MGLEVFSMLMSLKGRLCSLILLLCVQAPAPAYAVTGEQVEPTVFDLLRHSLVGLQPADGSSNCSGVLISPRYILTAGHCVRTDMPMLVSFFSSDREGVEAVPALKVILHPAWARNLPLFNAATEQRESWSRRQHRIVRRVARYNLKFDNLGILRACKFSDAGLDSFSNEEKFRAYLMQFQKNQKLRKRIVLKTAADRAARAKCEDWVSEGNEIYNEISRLNKEADSMLAQPRFPSDLAIVELPSPASKEHQPMKISFEFAPNGRVNPLMVIAGVGQTGAGESGRPTAGRAQILGEAPDVFSVGGSSVICPGDSGGPTAILQGGELSLVGINSETLTSRGGAACVLGENKGFVTKLSDYAEWLHQFLK